MQESDFRTEAHAKWILAGEHAVLRGSPALVFPIPSKFVELSYHNHIEKLEADFDAPYGETLLLLFWGVLETGLEQINKKRAQVTGRFFLKNNIPMGAGMGFSAALCVAVARWFIWKGWVAENKLFDFARRLEDSFHGKSSGVDIVGAMSTYGAYFIPKGEIHEVKAHWKPKLYLSYSDHVSVTSKCIQAVGEIWKADPKLGEQIDLDMKQSVENAERALLADEKTGLPLLTESIKLANSCFTRWGLISGNAKKHADLLASNGALAVKPTGAGDGGYFLSLWDKEPPQNLGVEFIAVFQ